MVLSYVFLQPKKLVLRYQIQVSKLLANARKIKNLTSYKVRSAANPVGMYEEFDLLKFYIKRNYLPSFQVDIWKLMWENIQRKIRWFKGSKSTYCREELAGISGMNLEAILQLSLSGFLSDFLLGFGGMSAKRVRVQF